MTIILLQGTAPNRRCCTFSCNYKLLYMVGQTWGNHRGNKLPVVTGAGVGAIGTAGMGLRNSQSFSHCSSANSTACAARTSSAITQSCEWIVQSATSSEDTPAGISAAPNAATVGRANV